MKIALVHDWLDTLGGAERVLIELHRMFPAAPIYTLFARHEFVRQHLPSAQIITSWLQRAPRPRNIRWAAAMATAIESFDLSGYDVVLSSSVFVAKGVVLRPKTTHICYCYSPTRQLWDRHLDSRKGVLSALGQHLLRIWDRSASDRVDHFVAISEHVKKRIKKYYRRDAQVVYPPMTLPVVSQELKTDEYLIVSRLYPHKNIGVAIEAFNKLGYTLNIVGDGPEIGRLRHLARPNIRFWGYQPDQQVSALYSRSRALIMPQEEDFGLTPVEAMAHGTPVLGLKRGGALEIIEEGKTGEFFDDPIPEALADGIRRLNENYHHYPPEVLQSAAARFSIESFRNNINQIIHENNPHHGQLS